uniref:R3H domain-containing protein n=1 Tax=Echeneis naucrates TaxID=173247 RepID=A0A665T2Z5_ECHNA
MAFPCFDGIYLPKQENEFLHQVMDELGKYKQKGNRKSVLLFPCLPSRLRYLIHKTIEDLPELTTFSVGESWCRRVVVCHSELRYKHCITNNYSSRKSSTYVHYLVSKLCTGTGTTAWLMPLYVPVQHSKLCCENVTLLIKLELKI